MWAEGVKGKGGLMCGLKEGRVKGRRVCGLKQGVRLEEGLYEGFG